MRANATDRIGVGARRLQGVVVLGCVLAGCSIHELTRPEGDGGWSEARRREELAARVTSAGVTTFDATPIPETRDAVSGALDLPTALALAARSNRHIAVAQSQVDAARARVWDARGRLLPATTGSGRYSWYSDEQTAHVSITGLPQMPDVPIRSADFGVVNGTVSLPLDLSGELRATLHAAQAG